MKLTLAWSRPVVMMLFVTVIAHSVIWSNFIPLLLCHRFAGKFSRVVGGGMYCICFPFQSVVARLSLRTKYMDVICDTKTKDNVFVKVVVGGKCCNMNTHGCTYF